jgi:hypothetical protein
MPSLLHHRVAAIYIQHIPICKYFEHNTIHFHDYVNQPRTQFDSVANSMSFHSVTRSFTQSRIHSVSRTSSSSTLPKFFSTSVPPFSSRFLQHSSNTSGSIFFDREVFLGCTHHVCNACYLTLIFSILLLLSYSLSY